MKSNIIDILEKKPEYRNALFRRGYLITELKITDLSAFPFYGNWKKFSFAKSKAGEDVNLYVHNDQQCYTVEKNDIIITLIGHALNPITMQYNEEDILNECIDAFIKSELTFFDKISELTGIHLIMLNDKGKILFVQDCGGLMPAYYGEINSKLYVSSHSQLIADLCDLKINHDTREYINSQFYKVGITQLCGLDAVYNELKMLTANTYLTHNEYKVLRFYPIKKLPEKFGNIHEEIIEILRNSLILCSKKWHCHISLTGGVDSKMTLAAVNGNYDKFSYFSFVSNKNEKKDADAAHMICKDLGLEHQVYNIPKYDSEINDFNILATILQHNQSYMREKVGNDLCKRIWLAQNTDIGIEIKSHVAEVARAFYYKKLGKKSFKYPLTPRNMSNLAKRNFFERKILKKMDRSFQNFIDITKFGNFPEGYDETDMFYWENRLSVWASLVKQSFDISHDTFIPYNNRKLLELMLTFPLIERINDTNQLLLIDKMNKQISDLNIAVNNTMKKKISYIYGKTFLLYQQIKSMCGINGIYKKSRLSSFKEDEIILEMNEQIIHRGPDGFGFHIEHDNINFSLTMGHRRLSIIDLTTGDQPIYTNDKSKCIVYNGEVYNYKELRNEYLSKDKIFRTETDTEVVLKLYEEYGVDSFAMLDGMYAFSIFDNQKNKIYIVRDFFGEKPVYYTKNNDEIYWASELKSIIKVLPEKPNISYVGMNLFFRLTYIPAPYTIYESISKLESGSYIEIDCLTGHLSVSKINYKTKPINKHIDFNTAKSKTFELVNLSVESRMVSDVPIGAFLSGGVDSSIVSLCMSQQSTNKINTFSIGFENKNFDETDKSKIVAKLINSNHNEFIIGEKDMLQISEKVLANFDEPFADSSAIATYYVANKTAKYVKVALTGDGGDEVFGGYNKYYIGKLNKKYTSVIPRFVHEELSRFWYSSLNFKNDQRGFKFKLKRLLKSIDYDSDFYYNIISLGFLESEAVELLNSESYICNPLKEYKAIIGSNNHKIHHFRNIDKLLSLEGDMLVKVDRTSMLSSLECRAPFLNKEIWDFTSSLPDRFLINGWDKKFVLKKAFEEQFPEDFLNNRKRGFGVPVGDWLRDGLKTELLKYIEPEFLTKQSLFNISVVSKLVKEHVNGLVDNTFRVWTFYCFQKWYENYSKNI